MNKAMIDRIQRETGVPDLIDVLVERLSPTDLQSLLLEVYRRRAARITPKHLLDRYEHDRFVRPSTLAPAQIGEFDRLAWSLLADRYTPIELAPVCPLGTTAAIATVDQNKVVTTIRNSEVVADTTNVLALTVRCAVAPCSKLTRPVVNVCGWLHLTVCCVGKPINLRPRLRIFVCLVSVSRAG